MKKDEMAADVTIKDGVAIIQPRAGRMIRAKVLGTRVIDGAPHHYLDRLVHPLWIKQIGPYRAEGAISTVLVGEKNVL